MSPFAMLGLALIGRLSEHPALVFWTLCIVGVVVVVGALLACLGGRQPRR